MSNLFNKSGLPPAKPAKSAQEMAMDFIVSKFGLSDTISQMQDMAKSGALQKFLEFAQNGAEFNARLERVENGISQLLSLVQSIEQRERVEPDTSDVRYDGGNAGLVGKLPLSGNDAQRRHLSGTIVACIDVDDDASLSDRTAENA